MYVRAYVRTYICTWWVTLRNVTRNVATYHRPYSYMCVTQSDTFRYMYGRRRSLAMELEVGDNGTAGPSQLGYYKHQTASPLLSYVQQM